MKLCWQSRKGNRSRTNNDAMGCYQDRASLIAIVVDAADKGPQGAGRKLAHFWAAEIIAAVRSRLEKGLLLSAELLLEQIKNTHPKLRPQHLYAMASYTLLGLNKQTKECFILHCGDCLAASRCFPGKTQWLIEPHHCYRQPGLEKTLSDPDRSILTRSLKARRLELPTVTPFRLSGGASILICTDGYWIEHLESEKSWNALEDDASALLITPEEAGYECIEESDNAFFHICCDRILS